MQRVRVLGERLLVVVALGAATLGAVGPTCAAENAVAPAVAASERDLAGVQEDVLGVQAELAGVLGASPAIVASPFTGMALAGWIAWATGTDAAVDSDNRFVVLVRDHPLVVRTRNHARWPLLSVLTVLAALSVLARSNKLSKGPAQAVSLVEVVLGGTFLGVPILSALARLGEPPAAGPPVESAGFPGAASGVLLGVAILLGIGVMMVVRLAFDVLIWLSPFPLVDLLFEIGKTVFCVLVFVLALVSPTLALILAGACFVVALFLFRWSWRWLRFAAVFVLGPVVLGRLRRSEPLARDAGVLARWRGDTPRYALRGCAWRAPGLPRRAAVGLVALDGGEAWVVRPRWRGSRRHDLAEWGERRSLVRGLFWHELRVLDAAGAPVARFALPVTVEAFVAGLADTLGAETSERGPVARALGRLGRRFRGLVDAPAADRAPVPP